MQIPRNPLLKLSASCFVTRSGLVASQPRAGVDAWHLRHRPAKIYVRAALSKAGQQRTLRSQTSQLIPSSTRRNTHIGDIAELITLYETSCRGLVTSRPTAVILKWYRWPILGFSASPVTFAYSSCACEITAILIDFIIGLELHESQSEKIS